MAATKHARVRVKALTSRTNTRQVAAVASAIVAVALAWAAQDNPALAARLPLEPPPTAAQAGFILVPTLSLSIHDRDHDVVTTVPAVTFVHPRARVTGSGATPTGLVTFTFFSNGTCSGDGNSTKPTQVLDGLGIAHETHEFVPIQGRDYSYRAAYSGDSRYAARSVCTKLAVTKISPSITFVFHNADHNAINAAFIQQPFHLKATTDGPVKVTGQVSFTVSTEADCSPNLSAGTVSLVNELAESRDFEGTEQRVYYYRARYLGDLTYSSKTSACKKITIEKRDPLVTLVAHDSAHDAVTDPVATGTKLHMSVTVSGDLGVGTGTADLRTYTDNQCTDLVRATPVTLNASTGTFDAYTSAIRTASSTPEDAYWRVRYGGDALYKPGLSPCVEVGWRAVPELELDVHNPAHVQVGAVAQGIRVHPSAHLAGEYSQEAGRFEFLSYTNATCSSGELSSGNRTLSAGGTVDADDFDRGTDAGTARSYRVIYKPLAASSYLPATSGCVAVSIIGPTATPGPTSKPTATPKPTTGPQPSATPGTAPATADPGHTENPEATADPGISAAPTASPDPGTVPTAAVSALPPSAATSAGPGPVDPSAASGGLDLALLLLLAIIVILAVIGSFFLGRRGRTSTS